jgi:type I restriction enzyme, S subunit
VKDAEIVKLGDIAKVISGYAFKSSEFCDLGIPVIKIANIRVGSVDFGECAKVSADYLQTVKPKYRVNPGDILISLTGSHLTQPNSVVGRVAKAPSNSPQCLLNQRAGKVIVEDVERCDAGYLYWHLSLSSLRGDIAVMASGAASQANVSPSQVQSLSVRLPSLQVQHRISSILSAYDDLIESNTRRIAILEGMARRLYEEWFAHFRFPGHEDAEFREDDNFGRTPSGWEIKPLGALVEIKKGKNITKKTIISGKVPVVAGGLKPAYYHNKANTTEPVVTVSASGANAGFVKLYQEDVWASDCSYIDATATSNVLFFYHLLKHHQIEITRMQKGTAQPHVYPVDLMELPVCEPPPDAVERFLQITSPKFTMIKNLSRKITNLRAQRDLLLPKLVSGEIEVSEAAELPDGVAVA